MGTLNYNTAYMRNKVQNLSQSEMSEIDRILLFLEYSAISGKFKDLDPMDFGVDPDTYYNHNS